MTTAEFSKFAGILSAALAQHHLSGFETVQLEFLFKSSKGRTVAEYTPECSQENFDYKQMSTDVKIAFSKFVRVV